jgi:hypothetical protein
MLQRRALEAGLLYAAGVFAGFGLGVVRVVCVVPLSGEFTAILVETPMMLAISWALCGWTTDRFEVPERLIDRLSMGAVALGLIWSAELLVGVFAADGDPLRYLADRSRPAMVLGLAAQIGFGLFPMLRKSTKS